jgi:galactokinase
MTGGGFGGCIVALLPEYLIDEVKSSINTHYKTESGLTATIYQTKAVEGVVLLS